MKGKDENEPGFYAGQAALPELLIASESIKNLVLNQASASEIMEVAKKEGYRTMKEWGAIMSEQGTTTTTEVARVTAE
jgi:general secretion pathway protein E